MKHLRVAGVLASCAVALTGCKKEAPPAPPPAPPPAAASAPPPPPPEPRADPECAAALTETPAAEVQVAGRKATSTGAKLVFADADADGEWTLGVLGPINEDSGANLIALQKYLKFFADEKVDAIAVSGDVGEVADGIARALTALGEAKVPVLVIAGNRECKADFIKGVERASATSGSVVNMNRVRSVEFPGAMVISLPGYHDPNYITCKTGCRYYKSTVDEVVTLAKASTRPAVLLAHGPFQGEGS
ncbi:MAG TPA: hypothetical protein VEY30_04340, partial [Myxococcaceae bacterium]|nr:hypothetical protein [Myxococcaceae bacterium]